MPVLDGQYEILAEYALGPQETLLDAIAPDGQHVRVTWYDLQTLDEESAFEVYRKMLRALRREKLAAIYDLVSRPGATYVVWRVPHEERIVRPKRLRQLTELRDILLSFDHDLSSAHIHSDEDGAARVFMLPFHLPNYALTPVPRDPSDDQSKGKGKSKPAALARSSVPVISASADTHPTPFQNLRKHAFGPHPPPQIGRRTRLLVRAWVPALTMFSLGIILLVSSFIIYAETPSSTVPNVIGLPVREAIAHLNALGLVSEVEAVDLRTYLNQPLEKVAPLLHDTQVLSDNTINILFDKGIHQLSTGTVIGMVPQAEISLRRGQSVLLRYASEEGKRLLTSVPDVVGRIDEALLRLDLQPILEAVEAAPDTEGYEEQSTAANLLAQTLESQSLQWALQEAQLSLGKVLRIPSLQPEGSVLAQYLPPTTQVEINSGLDVLISSGPLAERTLVLNLEGLSVEEAKVHSDLMGFPWYAVKRDYDPNAPYPAGTILSQNLRPGMVVELTNSVLRVRIAGHAGCANDLLTDTVAEQTACVPSFIGLNSRQAQQVASEYDLLPVIKTILSESLPAGVVFQDPPPYTPLASDTLNLVINKVLATPSTVPTTVPPSIPSLPISTPAPATTNTTPAQSTSVSTPVSTPSTPAAPAPPESPRYKASYRWAIEAGIPEHLAEVTASQNNTVTVVHREYRQGGQWVEGTWLTNSPQDVEFTLTLRVPEGIPYRYGSAQRVTPEVR